MNNEDNNRVLGRTGARELTAKEIKAVSGAIGTQTLCSFYNGTLDGDLGEC